MKPVCIKCKYYSYNLFLSHDCSCKDVPITNHVTGERSCYDMNHNGQCTYFEKKE